MIMIRYDMKEKKKKENRIEMKRNRTYNIA
jgi:hypothetical protein